MLYRAERFPAWSQLCVFLEEYAQALKGNVCDPSWHAGGCKDSADCKCYHAYFAMAASKTNNESIISHEKFGCGWFDKWVKNVLRAVEKGHTNFLMVTKP